MFVVPSGVSASRRATGAAASRGARLATTARRTGAQRLPERSSPSGPGVGTSKARSTSPGRPGASDRVDERLGVPFAVATSSAVTAQAATDATAMTPAAVRTPGVSR